MPNLTRASTELFKRPPDERFESLATLSRFCEDAKDRSRRLKEPSPEFRPVLDDGAVCLKVNGYPPARLNDWSFSQLCQIAGAAKETLNRLRPETAIQVLDETLRQRTDEEMDLQALIYDGTLVRSVNGGHYRRLWNADLVGMLQEFAVDFTLPQKGFNGATGLYAGEQDLFCFLIDPNGWVEIEGEAFAPGFFVWNSEVGKRTVGISSFWFQKICQNHIVWDAVDVVEVARKHTGRVRESLGAIREVIETLVAKRDERKDGFASVIAKAMATRYGQDADEVATLLAKAGFTKALAQQATKVAETRGAFTVWSVVDALTQLARELSFAGSRADADQKASALLALAR